jgi:hypothetical protein
MTFISFIAVAAVIATIGVPAVAVTSAARGTPANCCG